jgi:hypothetical protein
MKANLVQLRSLVLASCALFGVSFAAPSWTQEQPEVEARQAEQRFVERRRLARERDNLEIQRRELARKRVGLEMRVRQEQLLLQIQRQASEEERLAEERQASLQSKQRAARGVSTR